MQTYVSIYICIYIYMCENKLQCIICSDIHMSHNDNSRNVSHTFLIDHNLSGPGRSHAQAAKQHLLLISRPPARWATGCSGDLQHNYLLLYIMFCFCNVCTIVLEINILLHVCTEHTGVTVMLCCNFYKWLDNLWKGYVDSNEVFLYFLA